MENIYKSDIDQAIAQKKDNKKLVQKLRKLSERKIDDLFHDEHETVFESIDCLSCANCCKTTSPIFRDIDIARLSKHLKISVANFISQYLRIDEDQDYVLKNSPCPFLMSDNMCQVYDSRPLACRTYPHTDRKKMKQILNLTLKNTEICPAVGRIFSNLHLKINKS